MYFSLLDSDELSIEGHTILISILGEVVAIHMKNEPAVVCVWIILAYISSSYLKIHFFDQKSI